MFLTAHSNTLFTVIFDIFYRLYIIYNIAYYLCVSAYNLYIFIRLYTIFIFCHIQVFVIKKNLTKYSKK